MLSRIFNFFTSVYNYLTKIRYENIPINSSMDTIEDFESDAEEVSGNTSYWIW